MEFLIALFPGFSELSWQMLVMYVFGALLIWLAIKKEYEPMLLLPIGFGAILVNLPLSAVWGEAEYRGFLGIFYDIGIITELFPILIFIAIGAMIDFSHLLLAPRMMLFGAAAQFGIFAAMIASIAFGDVFPALGISLETAASIGIIGSADGPTSIVVSQRFAPEYLGAITVAAYSYMALVPLIQPLVIKALTSKKERLIRMDLNKQPRVSKAALIVFPIVITLAAGILIPEGAPLVGALMFGNLVRECGVLERLSKTAQNELANIVTLLLGITIGGTMRAYMFLQVQTLFILFLGLLAFIFGTASGVLFAKLMNLFWKEKVNPMIGAAGLSAFPISARVVQKLAKEEDPHNFILMQAVSANVSGQLGSIVAGGILLQMVPIMMAR